MTYAAIIHTSMEVDPLQKFKTALTQAHVTETSLEHANCEAAIALLTLAASADDEFLLACLRAIARGVPLYILRLERIRLPDVLKSAVVIDALRDLDWAIQSLVEQMVSSSRGIVSHSPQVENRGGTGDGDRSLDANQGDTPDDFALSPKPSLTQGEPYSADPVNFRAYYPGEVAVAKRAALHVYAAFKDELTLVARDQARFADPTTITESATARQTAMLAPGTQITITPECDEVTFNPPSLTKTWESEWMRFDFDFKPGAELAGESLFVRVAVMAFGVEIAHLKLSLRVMAAEQEDSAENPLAAARLQHSTGKIYQRIFVSYSRKDTAVVEIYRLIQLALGNEVFVDTYSIRTGEDWRTALASAIDGADVFQLFWSPASADSENVRHEWDYALHYRCKEIDSAGFIRPVVWVKPFPAVPPELSHLNFRYVPLLDYLPS